MQAGPFTKPSKPCINSFFTPCVDVNFNCIIFFLQKYPSVFLFRETFRNCGVARWCISKQLGKTY